MVIRHAWTLLLLAGASVALTAPQPSRAISPQPESLVAGEREIAGVRYEVAGAGHPVVLIHGGALDRRMWDSQFELLASRYLVIRYDVRGFGRSELPAGAFSHVEDLRRVLDAVEVASASLVGLSLGGAIALNFALTYPGRVDRLLLAAPAVGGMPATPEEPERFGRIGALSKEGRTREAVEEWLRTPHMRHAMATPAIASSIRAMALDNHESWAPNAAQAVSTIPAAASRLEEVRVPTWVMVGERDDRGVREVSARLAARIPGAVLIRIPDAGHILNLEAPEAFNAWLLGALPR